MASNEIITKVKELIDAPSCYAGLKDAAKAYLDAIDTDGEDAAKEAFVEELKADVCDIDGFIKLTDSDHGVQIFGEAVCRKMHISAINAKAQGNKYCLCGACQAGGYLLENL